MGKRRAGEEDRLPTHSTMIPDRIHSVRTNIICAHHAETREYGSLALTSERETERNPDEISF